MPDMPEPDQKRAVAPAVARPSRQSLVVPQPQSNLPLVIGALLCGCLGFGLVWAFGGMFARHDGVGNAGAAAPLTTDTAATVIPREGDEPGRLDLPTEPLRAAADDHWQRSSRRTNDADDREPAGVRSASLDAPLDAPDGPRLTAAQGRPATRFSSADLPPVHSPPHSPPGDAAPPAGGDEPKVINDPDAVEIQTKRTVIAAGATRFATDAIAPADPVAVAAESGIEPAAEETPAPPGRFDPPTSDDASVAGDAPAAAQEPPAVPPAARQPDNVPAANPFAAAPAAAPPPQPVAGILVLQGPDHHLQAFAQGRPLKRLQHRHRAGGAKLLKLRRPGGQIHFPHLHGDACSRQAQAGPDGIGAAAEAPEDRQRLVRA